MTGYSDEQIELMVARLGTDEYNQGVPRCAPWRTSPSCSGPDRWIVYQPTGSDQSRIIAEGVRQPFVDFIAAAGELVPSLLARAQQAEAALADVCCDECRRGTDVTSSEQLARLRAELAEAKAEADELRRLLLDETYRPEGGEIVMRELNAARSERDAERRRADHNANAVNENADMIVRLRAELAEAVAENARLRASSIVANDVLRRVHDAPGLGWNPADDEHIVAWHDSETTVEGAQRIGAERDRLAAQVAAVRAQPTLEWMQRTQPWTAPYSLSFEASKRGSHPRDDLQLTGYRAEPHRSLMHDLMHVTKAVGILASIAEWADHGSVRTERVDQAEFEGRIADLIMCALHMANNPPEGYATFDLQRAVIERVERVNGVAWRPAALDGTEQDEAKAPIRATCSGGGTSTAPGMALIEFRVPQGTERRLGAEWLLTPVSRPTEGDEQ